MLCHVLHSVLRHAVLRCAAPCNSAPCSTWQYMRTMCSFDVRWALPRRVLHCRTMHSKAVSLLLPRQVVRLRTDLAANQARELEDVAGVFEEESAKHVAMWEGRLREYAGACNRVRGQ